MVHAILDPIHFEHKCPKCNADDMQLKFISNVIRYGGGYAEGREGDYWVCSKCGYEESTGNEIIYG